MKKVTLTSITKGNNGLFTIAYIADGKLYQKYNVGINMYGYTFNVEDGVDDFCFMFNPVKDDATKS